jgi:hypothetical protein
MTVELTPRTGEPEDESARVQAVTPLDLNDLKDLDTSLQEWSSSADDEAFADLLTSPLWRWLRVSGSFPTAESECPRCGTLALCLQHLS